MIRKKIYIIKIVSIFIFKYIFLEKVEKYFFVFIDG